MGVSGSGKSTIGSALAMDLGVPFVDADDLHPLTNVERMRAGIPLQDDDRWPWLAEVGRVIAESGDGGIVVACSALRRSYREAILKEAPATRFVLLHGSRELLLTRMGARTEHFMPASLLDSQLATLEPLGADEPGITVAADSAQQELVDEVAAYFTAPPSAPAAM
jgi:gluconokinase